MENISIALDLGSQRDAEDVYIQPPQDPKFINPQK